MAHAISWFEIPTTDFDRARRFYEAVLGASLQPMEAPGYKMAAFPASWDKNEVSGCITHGEMMTPSMAGSLVYLNCGADLAPALARVEKAGGKILMPKTQIPMDGAGYMAMFTDTEGNRVGLHSMG